MAKSELEKARPLFSASHAFLSCPCVILEKFNKTLIPKKKKLEEFLRAFSTAKN